MHEPSSTTIPSKTENESTLEKIPSTSTIIEEEAAILGGEKATMNATANSSTALLKQKESMNVDTGVKLDDLNSTDCDAEMQDVDDGKKGGNGMDSDDSSEVKVADDAMNANDNRKNDKLDSNEEKKDANGDLASSGLEEGTSSLSDTKNATLVAAGTNSAVELLDVRLAEEGNGNFKEKMQTTGSSMDSVGPNAIMELKSKPNGALSNDHQDSSSAALANPAPPVMKGTLSYNVELRRHVIRGMWNYENSNDFPPQRFELLRNLTPEEEITKLPTDGEFHGSFSLAYFHTTSKGKQKERSRVIPESGVDIKFSCVDGNPGVYKVDGKGTNQFGVFHVNGTAKSSDHEGDSSMNIVLRKRYEPSVPTAATNDPLPKTKKLKTETAAPVLEAGPLPPPAESYPNGVVCLRGKLFKEESNDLGVTEVIQRINGMWASGLDFILADPLNSKGMLCRFEYEHKTSMPSGTFPVSGRYSGWFDLKGDDGTKTRINERDVVLKFRANEAGYHNVEGKGSNVFGKYTITGTLTSDSVITIFRHFVPRKIKANKSVTSAPPPINAPQARRPSIPGPSVELKLKMDDVKVPNELADRIPLHPIKPPEHSTYSAVSRGVLRLNEDGSHTCNGKWAVTREHFTNGQTSNFNFRLEAHHAAEALAEIAQNSDEPRQFPLDSNLYKGSFQLKKQAGRYQTVVDQQVVMKFWMNTQGSYNVYGKGMNAIGEFNLIGTLVMSGKTGGQVELYRMYPPERLSSSATPRTGSVLASTSVKASDAVAAEPHPTGSSRLPGPLQPSSLHRRESTRLVKLPSRLEDDDPSAQLSRVMEKCSQILRIMHEKDVELGAFFGEPVDPVALGIPTYHQVIKEPMDLKTIRRRLEADEINSPEKFARLVRLVFENAMMFNIDPAHAVHQSARNLLIQFNTKFRDVEHMLQTIRRNQGDDVDGKKKGKDGKRRREEVKSLRTQRLEEADSMAAENSRLMSAMMATAPSLESAAVTRSEFNTMMQMIQHLQAQIVRTYTAVAELSPGDENDVSSSIVPAATHSSSLIASSSPTIAERKKKQPTKRKSEMIDAAEEQVIVDDSKPLSLDEQELLTETINELPPDQLGGVIQIIREAAPVGADEDEIDLEIDQLDTKTQRKLLRHVLKFMKKSKTKAKKKPKTAPKKATTQKKPPKAALAQSQNAKSTVDSFFAFGGKDDSDSDSDDAPPRAKTNNNSGGKGFRDTSGDFKLGDGLGDLQDDDDIGEGGIATNWDLPKPVVQADEMDGEDDGAWGAAREEAAAAKAREVERKAREEKIKAEAEVAKKERLAAALALGEKLKEEREEEKEKEALLKEQHEKKAEEDRKAAREAARAEVQSVEQTVDMDAQRDIMKQYEESFLDKDVGSASPSSDFGF
jgi:hypothetical protein